MTFIAGDLPRFDTVSFGAASGGIVEQCVARLDGATKYWQLTAPIQVEVGGVIEYKFIGFTPLNSFRRFIGGGGPFDLSSGSVPNTLLYSSSTIDLNLNGEQAPQGLEIPNSGICLAELLAKTPLEFNQLAAVDSQRLLNIPILSVSVYSSTGVLTNEIPLTNKAQGATQLATMGTVNATMINYTGDEWECNTISDPYVEPGYVEPGYVKETY